MQCGSKATRRPASAGRCGAAASRRARSAKAAGRCVAAASDPPSSLGWAVRRSSESARAFSQGGRAARPGGVSTRHPAPAVERRSAAAVRHAPLYPCRSGPRGSVPAPTVRLGSRSGGGRQQQARGRRSAAAQRGCEIIDHDRCRERRALYSRDVSSRRFLCSAGDRDCVKTCSRAAHAQRFSSSQRRRAPPRAAGAILGCSRHFPSLISERGFWPVRTAAGGPGPVPAMHPETLERPPPSSGSSSSRARAMIDVTSVQRCEA